MKTRELHDILGEDDLVRKLRERYRSVPLLVFLRTMERSASLPDLFDALESVPKERPITWNAPLGRWIVVEQTYPWTL